MKQNRDSSCRTGDRTNLLAINASSTANRTLQVTVTSGVTATFAMYFCSFFKLGSVIKARIGPVCNAFSSLCRNSWNEGFAATTCPSIVNTKLGNCNQIE
eukprot:TRINITY_DN11186_c0_g1_i1.p2 TRINITY_DN11186_c0_g1~~TRINITY_DN11186_c0_g1_i1.p2  ORF type:complete len:100 (-),score=14.00 TRINITY_DN11186_c0_g1_i1:43-342(-)